MSGWRLQARDLDLVRWIVTLCLPVTASVFVLAPARLVAMSLGGGTRAMVAGEASAAEGGGP